MSTLLHVINVKRGELATTAVLFAVYFLILCSHYFLKPTRDALFLSGSGPAQLPLVFILTAIASAPITSFYMRRTRGVSVHRVLLASFLVLAVSLAILRLVIQIESTWVYYLFYVWVGIFGAVTTAQFWLLASAILDATQAKRIFALLATGGILGAVGGGQLTSVLVSRAGLAPGDLLWIAAAVIAGAGALAAAAWTIGGPSTTTGSPRRRADRTASRSGGSDRAFWREVTRRPHLGLLMGILGATVTVGTFVDYQFKTVAYETFSDPVALTAFFGTFYAQVSLASLLAQVLVSGRILGAVGAVGSLFVLPLTLVAGTVAMVAVPGLPSATFLRGGELTWKYSLDKTARELLFLPLPAGLKREAKLAADLFVDRWCRGVAGLLLLLLTFALGFDARGLAAASVVLLLGWLFMLAKMRSAYTEAFRRLVATGSMTVEPGTDRVTDPTVVDSLVSTIRSDLHSDRVGRIPHTLHLIHDAPSPALDELLPRLLARPEPALRRAAAGLLVERRVGVEPAVLDRLLDDEDAIVRREGARYRLRVLEDGERWFRSVLAARDPRPLAAGLRALAIEGDDSGPDLVTGRDLRSIVVSQPDRELRQAVLAFAAGRRSPEIVPWALGRLDVRADRAAARACLTAYGTYVLDALTTHLRRPDTRLATRRAIVYVIADIAGSESVRVLLDELGSGDRHLRGHLVSALYRVRERHPNLTFPAHDVRHALDDDARSWFATSQAILSLPAATGEPERLLHRALLDRRQQSKRRVFRLLALLYDRDDMSSACERVSDPDRVVRANAREYLERTLGSPERGYVIPMIDDDADVFASGSALFGLSHRDPVSTLRYFVTGPDIWLASCAAWASASVDDETLRSLVRDAQYGRYPLLRETARLALGRRSA